MPASPRPDGHAVRVAALAIIEERADWPQSITLGADKGYELPHNWRRRSRTGAKLCVGVSFEYAQARGRGPCGEKCRAVISKPVAPGYRAPITDSESSRCRIVSRTLTLPAPANYKRFGRDFC